MNKFIFNIQLFSDISNSTKNTVITGTASADSIYNSASSVTIDALGGNDTINNYSGSNLIISAGDGLSLIHI